MSMIQEFKDFAMKGNVIDLAVATVLGAAFNNIVGAVVDNVIMPIVGIITGGIDFDTLSLTVGSANLKYGLAITALVKFVAIALFLFAVIKTMNEAKKKVAKPTKAEQAVIATLTKDQELLEEIRDLLKKTK